MKRYDHWELGIHNVTFRAQLQPKPDYGGLSVTDRNPFQGGKLHHRPLLRAADREFDLSRHTARDISRRIRSGDSQPGVLSKVFDRPLYVYGGVVDEGVYDYHQLPVYVGKAKILSVRSGAVCLATFDGKGVWITHTRRPKAKTDPSLFPKVPAVFGLLQLGLLHNAQADQLSSPSPSQWVRSIKPTFQDVWIENVCDEHGHKSAYL